MRKQTPHVLLVLGWYDYRLHSGIEKYAQEHPDSPRTAQALYLAIYRQAVLTDMYTADEKPDKSRAAHAHAAELAAKLKERFPGSDYSCRAGALVYKLDEGIPVYGIDLE